MRWALSTLLASAHDTCRHRPIVNFGDGHPKLAQEEIKAIAGVWSASLKFEARYSSDLNLYLEPSGRVVPMDDSLPYNLQAEDLGWSWWSADRSVPAGALGDDLILLSLQLGHLRLNGRGQRVDFRVDHFSGEVHYEGADDDPVGEFTMKLTLPMKTSCTELEATYRRRIALRPPPPPTFAFSGFAGRWQMGLSEYDSPGSLYFPVVLCADGTWRSEGTDPELVGSWGVSSGGEASHGIGAEAQQAGSHLWLTISSADSADTFLGGRPTRGLDGAYGLEKQLMEKQPAEGEPGVGAAADDGDGGDGGGSKDVANRVDGRMWQGSEVRDYFGAFHLFTPPPAPHSHLPLDLIHRCVTTLAPSDS